MDESKTATAVPVGEKIAGALVDLGEDSIWAQFKLAGTEFEIEVFEAHDLLAEIDRKHMADPQSCAKCKIQFVVPEDKLGQTDDYICPGCGSKEIIVSQVFLDDVKILLREKFGVKRCARGEAAKFYTAIINYVETAKKNISTRLGLDSGCTLTPADSPPQSEGHT